MLETCPVQRFIVYANTIHCCETIKNYLEENGFTVLLINSSGTTGQFSG